MRRHMRICTLSFPSSNSLQPKNACILRCAVEGGQGTDGLAVPSVANPKHQEGVHWGPKSYETSLPKIMGFVYVFC